MSGKQPGFSGSSNQAPRPDNAVRYSDADRIIAAMQGEFAVVRGEIQNANRAVQQQFRDEFRDVRLEVRQNQADNAQRFAELARRIADLEQQRQVPVQAPERPRLPRRRPGQRQQEMDAMRVAVEGGPPRYRCPYCEGLFAQSTIFSHMDHTCPVHRPREPPRD